jgi:hypothetical protein
MPTVCIICEKEKHGERISDDIVISTIRAVKAKFGWAKNNTLVVCSDCMQEHKKKRATFERRIVWYGGLGVIFAALLMLVSFSLPAIFGGLIIVAILVFTALLSYHPTLVAGAQAEEKKSIEAKPQKKKSEPRRKK